MPRPSNNVDQTLGYGRNNPNANRRALIDGGTLLKDGTVGVEKLKPSVFGDPHADTMSSPGYHSESSQVEQEAGTRGVAHADHNHDLTYLRVGSVRRKGGDDSDYVAPYTLHGSGIAQPFDKVNRRIVVWTWDEDYGPPPICPINVYARFSLDSGATYTDWGLVGVAAPGETALVYEADARYQIDDSTVLADHKIELVGYDRSAAMKVVGTGSDGLISNDFLGSGAAGWYFGAGSPEGVQTATVGKGYRDTTNGNVYVKATGTGNTGWALIYRVGGTDVAVADGGTGASTAPGALTNLGIDTDGTLAGNSDTRFASQKATKTYADAETTRASAAEASEAATRAAADLLTILKDGSRAFTGDQSMGSHKITNVTDPASAQDADTKAARDAAIAVETARATAAEVALAAADALALAKSANLSDVASAGTSRTNLGVGTGDSPQFAGVNVGHASDTTITRASAGDIAVEGKKVYRLDGTDVSVADGGTGASDAANARTNLGLGSVATLTADPDTTLAANTDNNVATQKATKAYVDAAAALAANPTSTIIMTGSATTPTGYLPCDGSAVSRSTYAALFAAIGTGFGSGDGSTTFNVPSMGGRFPQGKDGSNALGSTGGAVSPTITDPGHSHIVGQASDMRNGGATTYDNASPTNATTTGISIADGRPPYLTFAFYIKT